MLLDIEGTTTPIEFVHKTLFRYARARVSDFLERHWNDPEVRTDIARLAAEHSAEVLDPALPRWHDDIAGIVAYLHWLMDRDRKSTGLKSLQGKIWSEGYRSGYLKGEVYPDVLPALERWRGHGIDIAIFSSGSIQAQRELFSHSVGGDLTPFIRAYFDTTTGPKRERESYTRIAAALERSPGEVLFVSDVASELDVARSAGMEPALCVRAPGSGTTAGTHPLVREFDQLTP